MSVHSYRVWRLSKMEHAIFPTTVSRWEWVIGEMQWRTMAWAFISTSHHSLNAAFSSAFDVAVHVAGSRLLGKMSNGPSVPSICVQYPSAWRTCMMNLFHSGKFIALSSRGTWSSLIVDMRREDEVRQRQVTSATMWERVQRAQRCENKWHKGQDDNDWDNNRETMMRASDKYNDVMILGTLDLHKLTRSRHDSDSKDSGSAGRAHNLLKS